MVFVIAVRSAARCTGVGLVKRVQLVLFGVLREVFAGFIEVDGAHGDA